jgi:UDP-N-acetylmuramoylalanine--D-glutamate ligase
MGFLIFGLGKTGFSALKYLYSQSHSCVVFDTRSSPLLFTELKQDFPSIPCFFENFPEEAWLNIHAIVVSPGLNPGDLKVQRILQEAKNRNLVLTSDIELFLKAVKAQKNSRVIGITGSNGKSTVTALVVEMLKASGLDAKIGGNFGIPALDLLGEEKELNESQESQESKIKYYVLELSSFQLELLSEPPELFVSTVLNLSPNHLDRHKNLEDYQLIKERIYARAQFKVMNRAMRYFSDFSSIQVDVKSENLRSFGLDLNFDWKDLAEFGVGEFQGEEWLFGLGSFLMPVSEIKILGRHNVENALAALAIVSVMDSGMAPGCLQEALGVLKTFGGLPHRCRWVAERKGVTWVNDSKSTTSAATRAALEGFGPRVISEGGRIILIAGGQAKGATFESLSKSVAQYVKALVVFGQDAKQFVQDLNQSALIYVVKDLCAAMDQAQKIAEPNDLVLLSPACASLDMFKSYEHRGEVFESEILSRMN